MIFLTTNIFHITYLQCTLFACVPGTRLCLTEESTCVSLDPASEQFRLLARSNLLSAVTTLQFKVYTGQGRISDRLEKITWRSCQVGLHENILPTGYISRKSVTCKNLGQERGCNQIWREGRSLSADRTFWRTKRCRRAAACKSQKKLA